MRRSGSLDGSGMETAFHSWSGHSGRRYVFTIGAWDRVDDEALRAAVVIVAWRDREGRMRPIYIGDFDGLPARPYRPDLPIQLHYHLLAPTAQARAAVIADLTQG